MNEEKEVPEYKRSLSDSGILSKLESYLDYKKWEKDDNGIESPAGIIISNIRKMADKNNIVTLIDPELNVGILELDPENYFEDKEEANRISDMVNETIEKRGLGSYQKIFPEGVMEEMIVSKEMQLKTKVKN